MDRKTIADALAVIESKAGRLTPDAVIEAARPKDSVLHNCFTWDKTEAAAKQLLYEARSLIRSVRVTTVVKDRVFRTIAYVRDPSVAANDQGYISVAKLRTDADMAREVLLEEFGRAASAMRRALEVSEAVNLRDEVQRFVRDIQTLTVTLEQRQ